MASRSSWRLAICSRGDLAARQQLRLQRRVRALRQVVEAGAHVELAAVLIENGEVERHAERVDRAALRIGQIHLQIGAGQRVPQLLLHPLRPQGVEHQRLCAGRSRASQATTCSSAAAASRCSQAQSNGEYRSRPTKLSALA